MTERYEGVMIKKVGVFFEDALKEDYTACDTFIVSQPTLDDIKPPRTYPNPDFVPIHVAIHETGFPEVRDIVNEAYKGKICNREECVISIQNFTNV